MQPIFPHSRDLKQIIEQHGWSLYDVTLPQLRTEPFSWEEINILDPAEVYTPQHRYMFIPEPKEGQKLADAYAEARTHGFMPSLNIPQDKLTFGIYNQFSYHDLAICVLHELYFKENEVIAMSHPLAYPPYSPRASLFFNDVLPVFNQYFSIIQSHRRGINGLKSTPRINLN